MQIGDNINFVPFVMRYNKGNSELQSSAVPGRVVWIHPEGRYAVVERTTKYYTYRECIPVKRRIIGDEDNCNYEPERRGRKNGVGPKFGRRPPARRKTDDAGGL